MAKKLYIVLLSCLLFSACSENSDLNSQIIVLHKEYDLPSKLDINNNLHGFGKRFIDDKNNVIRHDIISDSWKIIRVNVTEGKVEDSVDANLFGLQFLDKFFFISKDSILLAFSAGYMNGNHDQALIITDRKKNILHKIPLSELPVKTRQKQIGENERYSINYWHYPLVINQGNVYVPLHRWNGEEVCNPNDSLVAIISVHASSPVQKLPICPVCPPEGYFWNYNFLHPRGTWANNCLYTFYGNNPVLYRYNSLDKTLDTFRISFQTTEEITPYRGERDKGGNDDPYKSLYQELHYDSLRNQFIWVARVGCDRTDSPLAAQYDHYIYSFVVLDSNLNKTGEGILPEGYSPNFIPYKDGFLFLKAKTGGTVYTYFSYQVINDKASVLNDQIKLRREELAKISPRLSESQAFRKYFSKLIGDKGRSYKKFIVIPSSTWPNLYTHLSDTINVH